MFFNKKVKKAFSFLFFTGLIGYSFASLGNENNHNLSRDENDNVATYNQFIDDVNNQIDSGKTLININYDVDLSAFSSDNVIEYTKSDPITFDFGGHTIKNKSNVYNNTSGPSGSNTLIATKQDEVWGYQSQFLFNSIDDLTIKNAIIENSTFIVWDSSSLTLDKVIFSDSYLENIYLKSAGSSESKRYLPLFGDLIDNLTITNSAFNNVGIRQTVWNYQNSANSSNIGLFTRIGSTVDSELTLENNYFGEINFSNNQRGVQDNQKGNWNVGLFNGITGKIISNENYYDRIFFAINNDSLEKYKISALFIFLKDKFTDAKIENDKIGAFVNSYKTSANEFFYAANESYFSSDTPFPGKDLLLEANFDVKNTFLIDFTEEESNDYIKENFGTAPLGIVSINDFANSTDSFENISLTQFKSQDFLSKNFDSDFYLINEEEFPTPILSTTFLEEESINSWAKININYRLKNGFSYLNPNDLSIINFYQRGESKPVASYELEFNNLSEVVFTKPNKNKDYYYEIVNKKQSIFDSNYYSKMPIPVWISLLISIIVIAIFLVLLLLFLLFLRRKQKETANLQMESENISLAIYDSANLFGFDLDEALYLLELNEQDLSFKTLETASKKLTKNYEKKIITYDQYLKKYEAIIYLKSYLGEEK